MLTGEHLGDSWSDVYVRETLVTVGVKESQYSTVMQRYPNSEATGRRYARYRTRRVVAHGKTMLDLETRRIQYSDCVVTTAPQFAGYQCHLRYRRRWSAHCHDHWILGVPATCETKKY